MYILGLILVAIISSFFTLALHCMIIVGRENDKEWEEEQNKIKK